MTASDIFQALEPFVKANSASVSATINNKRGFDTVYSVNYSIKQEDHPPVYLSVSFFAILNNETLLQRVVASADQGKLAPPVDEESIRPS